MTGGLESCLNTYHEILSTRHYVYGGAGRCKDEVAVVLTCESMKKCSFAESSVSIRRMSCESRLEEEQFHLDTRGSRLILAS